MGCDASIYLKAMMTIKCSIQSQKNRNIVTTLLKLEFNFQLPNRQNIQI